MNTKRKKYINKYILKNEHLYWTTQSVVHIHTYDSI